MYIRSAIDASGRNKVNHIHLADRLFRLGLLAPGRARFDLVDVLYISSAVPATNADRETQIIQSSGVGMSTEDVAIDAIKETNPSVAVLKGSASCRRSASLLEGLESCILGHSTSQYGN